jgi:predicted HTH transcriptional regulator
MIHRDYYSEGRVLIEIFSDRVEISNPGSLLFDEKDFGKVSVFFEPRNIFPSFILQAEKIKKQNFQ